MLQRQRTDASVRRGDWVALADISPALRTALVLSEDKRFYEHGGVDWAAVSAAAWGNLWNQRTRGASTITMQLAGLLDGDWRQGPGGRSVVQKLGQTVSAQVLDRRWRKDQILEAYLNLVPFRGEIVIDALSRTLFGKAAHGLDAREAAIAAALVRAPNASPERVGRRACGVLQSLAPEDAAARDCTAMELLTASVLLRRQWAASEGQAPHLARRLLAEPQSKGQARVRSTLSAPVQRFAVQSLQQQLRELQGRNVEDGAIVVLDNATGEVLAWVGSSGELSQAAEVDGVTAMRQPGSTLKPFLYAQAIAERRLTAASLIEDSSAHIPTQNGLYIPQNYDRRFKGWVSARTALASSLNVPAVRTLVMVTPDAFFSQLQRLGLPLRESGGYHGFSLALGSAEVPLLQLTNAYRALANGGQLTPVRWAAQPTGAGSAAQKPAAPVQAIDARAAFIVGDILSDPMARAPTFGTDSVLATRFWTAVKTGTSKDMRDNWAVGWSQRYTVGVWVGNARGEAMHSVSGTSGAAPVWAAVMGFLHAHAQPRAQGAGGRAAAGCAFRSRCLGPAAGERAQRMVRGGHAAEPVRHGGQRPACRIRINTRDFGRLARAHCAPGQRHHPRAGPRHSARPPARAAVGSPGRHGRHAGMAGRQPALAHGQCCRARRGRAAAQGDRPGAAAAWMPWPGRHRLELVDAKGQVLDSVQVEVRGAGVVASRAGGR